MFKLDFLLKYNLDRETNDFILKRVRKMLAEKKLVDEKYHAYNDKELELARELILSLPMELQNLLDDYRSSVLSRETQGLIFAYLLGMKDGMNYTKIVEQFADKL